MPFRSDFPLPDADWLPTREFWASASRHVLSLPRCDACMRLVWYPDGPCRACGATAHTWTPLSGRGSLFSWSVVHRPFIPQFASWVPFVTGLVAVEEDPTARIATLLVDCPPGALVADMPVRVVFRPLSIPGVDREVIAPMFVPD